MAETKHAVVRTDNMTGTDVRSQLVSIKYMGADGETPTAIDNGNVLKVGDLLDGEREVYCGETPAAADAITDIVLIASVEVMYDERKKNLDEYENESGKICRGYRLNHGDIFSVTAEALTGTKAVGDVVELAAGTKLNTAASATASTTSVGSIIAIDTVGRHTYYVVKVD